MTRKDYVLAFVFCYMEEGEPYVLLLKKIKPEWQRGMLNGIGGKIEHGEQPLEAMSREWTEETALPVPDWKPVCLLAGDEWRVFIYTGVTEDHWAFDERNGADTPEGILETQSVEEMREFKHRMIPNIMWLVPKALSVNEAEGANGNLVDNEYILCLPAEQGRTYPDNLI